MGSEKKIKMGYILIILLLAITLFLSVFLIFAHNEDLPMLKSTGAGLLGFGEEKLFTTRGGAVKMARPDYFSNIYEFSDGDTFMVAGWFVRILYWLFCVFGIYVLINAGVAYFSKSKRLGKVLTFLICETCFGFAIVAIALISIGYPSLIYHSFTYSTQYYFLLIPLTGALAAAVWTKRELKASTATQTRAYPANKSVPEVPPVAQAAAIRENKKPVSILDRYRLGLSYLDACGAFDEYKFREFNRIAGNQFSDADMAKQLGNARMTLKGMDDLKQTLRSTMIEAIQTFEELERGGVDLSKYNE
ncbi:MAG: hypothetical protein ACOX2M_08550 [Fastidiosipilaceae bacterium]|jgi:hypothetical protein